MKVVNAASRPLTLRGFVGQILSPNFRLIFPKESEDVTGPDLPNFGLKPYNLPGLLVVRDIGFVQTDLKDNCELALVEAGKVTVYKRPFGICPYFGVNEGVIISFHHESHLIGL